MYIRENQVSSRPYHFTIDFLHAETEYVRLYLDEEKLKVKKVEFEEDH